MFTNLNSIYLASETRARWSMVILAVVLLSAIVGTVFVSAGLVLAIVIATTVFVISCFKPSWSLFALLMFLPFEPFLLKWVPDEIYVYARYSSEMLIYVLLGVIIWKIIVGEIKFKRTPIDLQFLFLIFALAASIVINLVPVTPAILGLRQILRFVVLFFMTVQLAPSKTWIRAVVTGLVIILLFQACLGAAQIVIGESLDTFLLPSNRRTLGDIQLVAGNSISWDPGQRIFGTLGRYDQLGTFMAMVMLLVVAALYEKILPERSRVWLYALLIASLPILAFTYSRSAWFGFLLGLVFIGVYLKRDKYILSALIIIPILLTLYVAITGLVVRDLIDVPDQTIVNRLFEAFSYERWTSEYYGIGRLYWIVQTFTAVIPAAPIFGHGPGMYGGGTAAALGNTTVYDELSLPFGVFGTEGFIDNNWLSLWGETGTVGLSVYIWLLATLFLVCLLVGRRSSDSATRALAIGTCAIILAVALNAFLATYLEVRTLAPYMWVFAGVVVSLGQRERIL